MQYALIGEKLGHSFSKDIHESVFGYSYELCPLSPDKLDSFLKTRDFLGLNVTIPYKQAVIPYLDGIDKAAEKIGAVNTVVKRGGKLYGYNTDFYGMKMALLAHGVELCDKTVLILGTGGTSLTAKAVCEDMGAAVVKRVSRNPKGEDISYEMAESEYTLADVIINTTPVGMYPNADSSPIDLDSFPFLEAVVDAIYNPLNTKLVTQAKNRGITAVSGLYMLVAQAVRAGEIFLDKQVAGEVIFKEYNRILKSKQNIVLIGMPSSGKTTVGEKLAKMLSREMIDCDSEIEKVKGMSIPNIFSQFGEKEFRDIESQVIKSVSALQGKVISTGGGAVLREENVALLKQNGVLVYLDRPLEKLTPTCDRPLSSDITALKQRYEERKPIYENCCDVTVLNDGELDDTVKNVKEMFLL